MSVPFDFRMQLILSLSREISGSFDLKRILRFLKASITTFMPQVSWMNIFEIEDSKVMPVDEVNPYSFEKNKIFFENILKKKEYIYIENVEEMKGIYYTFEDLTKSALWIPLKKWDKVEGLWGIEARVIRGFKLEDIIFSRIIGDFVGVSISNIKLLRENEERRKDFETAYEISMQINKPLGRKEVIRLFLKLLCERLSSVYTAFFEKKKDVFYLVDYYSPYKDVYPVNTQFLPGEGLVGACALKKELIYVNDVATSKEYKRGVEGIKSEMSVPIVWENEVVGVIDIGSRKNFSRNEIFTSSLLANTFALAYYNSKYYEELERYINQMEEVLHEKTQELVKSEKFALIGQMSSVVIHEIKNLLSGISAMSELILMKVNDPNIKEIAKTMQEESSRAFTNLTNILEYVKPLELKMQKVPLKNVVEKALTLCKGFFKDKKIRVNVKLEENLPEIPMDEDKIKEVFINLIANAAQAIENKGFIKIYGYKKNDYIIVEVEDNGKGIKEEHLKRIFEPFFTTRKGGTGIGLARVKKILEYHSWDIEVESIEGKGSIFRIKIPLRI